MFRFFSSEEHRTGLLDLPNELQLSIVEYLQFPHSQNLTSSNRHFRTIIKPATIAEL